jgi:hypothetical protein
VPESYPSPSDCSSLPLPELPDLPTQRYQFNLKQLLAFMLICAVLATVARYVLEWMQTLPKLEVVSFATACVAASAFGGLLYFFFRAPFLLHHAGRFLARWKRIQQHKAELTTWIRQRRKQGDQQAPSAEQSRII